MHAALTPPGVPTRSTASRRRGFATAARDAPLSSISVMQPCCRSAQEIFDGIREQGGRVGIASVYRALDQLVELDLVQRVELGDGIARFEPSHPDGEHHHHLVCDDCGKVEPFSDPGLEQALERAASRLDVRHARPRGRAPRPVRRLPPGCLPAA